MEMQRCVWRCLEGRGADDPAYHACVDRVCTGQAAATPDRQKRAARPGRQSSDPTRVWQTGSRDGARYAGIDAPGRAGEAGLYYTCYDGRGSLMVLGLGKNVERLRLVIDRRPFEVNLRRKVDGNPARNLKTGSRLMRALQSGERLVVRRPNGTMIWRLSLDGSSRALSRASRNC